MSKHRVDPSQSAAEEILGTLIRNLLVVVCTLAIIGLLLPSRFGLPLEIVAVTLVVVLPFARIAWLVRRWWLVNDTKYVWWAVALLALVAVGPILALI